MINEARPQDAARTSGVAPVQFSAPAEAGEFDAGQSAVAFDATQRSPFSQDAVAASGE
ncbi:hypothetical protein [Amycolatopsis antarctica]|uniref:hypothetical protein n=1 Tax=Amycolatopsis antarctica TaxID=1854586 RepID=UPI0013FE4C69|nr:hypothetical protein [Amycolatopsis antarctica]